jgi:DNA-binding transcriptional regulator YdaS (Cro superfamily)
MKAITKSALARRLGVTRGRISQLCSQGMPVLANGCVDVDVACQWISEHVDRGHSGWSTTRKAESPASAATPSLETVRPRTTSVVPSGPAPAVGNDPGRVLLVARAKKALADARRAERLERHQADELIERTVVVEYTASLSALVRDHMLAQPERLADRLEGMSDRAEIYRILRDDGRALLERLSRAINNAGRAGAAQ